jgi:hypothetical protein
MIVGGLIGERRDPGKILAKCLRAFRTDNPLQKVSHAKAQSRQDSQRRSGLCALAPWRETGSFTFSRPTNVEAITFAGMPRSWQGAVIVYMLQYPNAACYPTFLWREYGIGG